MQHTCRLRPAGRPAFGRAGPGRAGQPSAEPEPLGLGKSCTWRDRTTSHSTDTEPLPTAPQPSLDRVPSGFHRRPSLSQCHLSQRAGPVTGRPPRARPAHRAAAAPGRRRVGRSVRYPERALMLSMVNRVCGAAGASYRQAAEAQIAVACGWAVFSTKWTSALSQQQ
jgi:hypothetical protein